MNGVIRERIGRLARTCAPFFGHDGPYFIGSGTVGASGNPDGEWSFAVGPDLTGPDFLESETIRLSGFGKLPFEMRRLRGRGAFFGIAFEAGVYRASLTEVTPPDALSILRYLTLENESAEERVFTLEVRIRPGDQTRAVAKDGLEIIAPEGCWCFGNHETKNWAERRMRVVVPGASCEADSEFFVLRLTIGLPAGGIAAVPIRHEFAYGDAYPAEEDPEAFLERGLSEWEKWLARGKYPNAIRDRLLRDAAESLLLNVRMQQNRDGGMIAGIRKYANSYVRDTHGGMRLLNICGHADDVGRLLLNVHSRWEIAGFIPNWWSMGSDTFIGDSFCNNASEVTAYYIFMARDYLAAGGDESLVSRIMPSVRWAADKQIRFLKANEYLMTFNGDESEQYCVHRDGEEYGPFGSVFSEERLGFDKSANSFAATMAAAGSLEWFAEYSGEDRYREFAAKVRERMESVFWDRDALRHGWISDGDGLCNTVLTNALLMPVWLHVPSADGREAADAKAAIASRDPDTGYIPNCPGVSEGFCGHTPGLALYCAAALGLPEADGLTETVLNSNLLSRYGTVSEFYGPGGTPNGHGNRPYEGGIVGEALVYYAMKYGK
jgi:hypothetical protein